MSTAIEELEAKGKAAKAASHRLAYLSTEVKNKALANIANDLLARKDKILAANETDCKEGRAAGMDAAML
ncbi:gamma-glutamyl-phosphate reductase, partial [Chloroflexota bacterium]